MEKYDEPVDRLEMSDPDGTVIFEDEFQIVVMHQPPVPDNCFEAG